VGTVAVEEETLAEDGQLPMNDEQQDDDHVPGMMPEKAAELAEITLTLGAWSKNDPSLT
jgi:hypothetical protein